MKNIFLIIAIFIATQSFSQTIDYITIKYNTIDVYTSIGQDNNINKLISKKYLEYKHKKPGVVTRTYDIKNMKSYFKLDTIENNVKDIVKFEQLSNGIIHIVVEEPYALYEDKSIHTHQYIDTNKNSSVYSWKWDEGTKFTSSFAIKAVNPIIDIK
mgnify:CR=1 FL=1